MSRSGSRVERLVLLGPGLAYLTLFAAVPVLLVLATSLFQRGRFGGIVYEPTCDNFTRALGPVYREVFSGSVLIAGVTTLLALLIGYPWRTASRCCPAGGARWPWCWWWCRSGPTS